MNCRSSSYLEAPSSTEKKSLLRRRHSREGALRSRCTQPSETVALRRSRMRQLSNTACTHAGEGSRRPCHVLMGCCADAGGSAGGRSVRPAANGMHCIHGTIVKWLLQHVWACLR